jgi:hypothetical protein
VRLDVLKACEQLGVQEGIETARVSDSSPRRRSGQYVGFISLRCLFHITAIELVPSQTRFPLALRLSVEQRWTIRLCCCELFDPRSDVMGGIASLRGTPMR